MAGLGQAQMTPQQCQDSIQAGADRWCGLEFYDSVKCQHATEFAMLFGNLNSVLSKYEFSQIPDITNLFGPFPPSTTTTTTPGVTQRRQ